MFLLHGGGPPTISTTSGPKGSATTSLFKGRFAQHKPATAFRTCAEHHPATGAPPVRPRKQGGGEDPCAPFKASFQSNLCKPPCSTAVAGEAGGFKMQPSPQLVFCQAAWLLNSQMGISRATGAFEGRGSRCCKAESEVPQGCVHSRSKSSCVPLPPCLLGLCNPFLNCSPGSESATLWGWRAGIPADIRPAAVLAVTTVPNEQPPRLTCSGPSSTLATCPSEPANC